MVEHFTQPRKRGRPKGSTSRVITAQQVRTERPAHLIGAASRAARREWLRQQEAKERASSKSKAERNKQLIAYFLENHTLEEVGQKFGITRERVRQILKKAGVTSRIRSSRSQKFRQPRKRKLPVADRFWQRVDKNGEIPANLTTPCWNWTAARTATDSRGREVPGYGHMHFRGKLRLAHHISWMLTHRKLSVEGWILRKCRNTLCVNPDHLYSGTPRECAAKRDPEYFSSQIKKGWAEKQAKEEGCQNHSK